LVELQRNLPDFERNNIAVFGISYDPVDVLTRFAGAHGVTFPLLSDEGSKVIRELGMLDEQVYEHHAAFDVTARRSAAKPAAWRSGPSSTPSSTASTSGSG